MSSGLDLVGLYETGNSTLNRVEKNRRWRNKQAEYERLIRNMERRREEHTRKRIKQEQKGYHRNPSHAKRKRKRKKRNVHELRKSSLIVPRV